MRSIDSMPIPPVATLSGVSARNFAGVPGAAQRIAVVLTTLSLHLLFGLLYWMQADEPRTAIEEMSVVIAAQQPVITPPQSQPSLPKPAVPRLQPRTVNRPQATEAAEMQKFSAVDTAPSAGPVVAAPEPAPVVETEPDYKADYLHNPRPAYPLIARRMRYQGRVLLDVEVLTEGCAGQVRLHRSSGYEALDNCALETVKSWRFTPAKRAGQAITRHFIVPIIFTLEDTKA